MHFLSQFSKARALGESLKVAEDRQEAATASNTSTLLLSLPPELRNKIYALALHLHSCIRIRSRPPKAKPRSRPIVFLEDREPPLLQVCRQLRIEAIPMYYHNNIVVWTRTSERRTKVQHHVICLQVWLDHLSREGSSKHLQRMEILFNDVCYQQHPWSPRTCCMDMRVWIGGNSPNVEGAEVLVWPCSFVGLCYNLFTMAGRWTWGMTGAEDPMRLHETNCVKKAHAAMDLLVGIVRAGLLDRELREVQEDKTYPMQIELVYR